MSWWYQWVDYSNNKASEVVIIQCVGGTDEGWEKLKIQRVPQDPRSELEDNPRR